LLNNLESILQLIFTSEASGLCSILNDGNTTLRMIVRHCQCLCSHEVISAGSQYRINSEETVRQTQNVNRFLLDLETKSTSVFCCTAVFFMSTSARFGGSFSPSLSRAAFTISHLVARDTSASKRLRRIKTSDRYHGCLHSFRDVASLMSWSGYEWSD